MAYTHSRYEVEMIREAGPTAGPTMAGAVGSDLSVTTVLAAWGPGYVPHRVRGAAVVISASNSGAFTGAAVGIQFGADISTPGTVTNTFNISLPSSGVNGVAVYYTPTYTIELPPGSRMEAHATTAATAGVRARLMLYVEPRWEEPANVTTMRAAT